MKTSLDAESSFNHCTHLTLTGRYLWPAKSLATPLMTWMSIYRRPWRSLSLILLETNLTQRSMHKTYSQLQIFFKASYKFFKTRSNSNTQIVSGKKWQQYADLNSEILALGAIGQFYFVIVINVYARANT